MKKILLINKKFFHYQKERFPIIVLAISFLPAILSSGTVSVKYANVFFIDVLIALIASIFYLLYIRILDEERDFTHDTVHHSYRPIIKGDITLQELYYFKILSLLMLVLVASVSGVFSWLILLIMLSYSYIAYKEFFIVDKLKKYFLLYNAMNLVQIFLLQVFIYTIFLKDNFEFTHIIFLHFVFTSIGSLVFEFLRKVKVPGDDGVGKDTYTHFIGFKNSLFIYSVLLLFNFLLFIALLFKNINDWSYILILPLSLLLFSLTTILFNYKKKEKKYNELMQLSFVVFYSSLNLLIYLNL